MGESIKLSEIEIKSFRGIKNYTLETNNNSIVFCGANGTGKSSFVNAFEFLFTGKVKSLSGIGGLSHDKSIIHIGDKKNDVSVKAKINKHTIQRTFNGIEYDDELKEIYDDFKNGSFLLNRQKLLEFIDAKPAERWKVATNLISFDKYDETEKVLEKVKRSYDKQQKDKNNELEKNTKILGSDDLSQVYDEINKTLKENDLDEIKPETDLNEFLKDNSIHNINFDDINITQINEKYQNQLNVFERITLNELKNVNSLLSILKNSKEYLIEEESDICPVCQNKIDSGEVLAYLNTTQEEIEKSNSKLNNWQKETAKLIVQIRTLNYRLPNHDLTDLIIDLDKLNNLEITPSEMDRDILANLENELNIKKDNDEKLSKAFDTIITLSKRQNIENELAEIQKYLEIAETTLKTFSETKKNAITDIFEKIESLVDEYYEFIHEDDEINSPKINVKNSKGLTLGLIFDEDDEDPRSYSSEGHLDSLGLCIFLAFAKLYNKYNLLILDDIISTVDLDHKEMVIRLLFEKFPDYTFIITTHNKLWYEQLQRLASSNNMRHKFTFMEIIDWDKTEGPILSKNINSKKRIEEHLNANDTFAAGNAIRRHFEFILDDLCKINRIPLPIKKHYTVNDYYKPVKKYFLEGLFKNTDVEEYYKSVFKELDDTTYMGNLLSHNNEENYYLVKSEIEKFKLAVYNFENAFRCEKHNKQYLTFDKKKRIGICGNEKCQDIFKFSKS